MFTNWKRLLLAVYRLEEGQQEILAKLDEIKRGPRKAGWLCGERTSDGTKPCCLQQGEGCKVREDEWLQDGIDNILSYSVEKKKEVDEE